MSPYQDKDQTLLRIQENVILQKYLASRLFFMSKDICPWELEQVRYPGAWHSVRQLGNHHVFLKPAFPHHVETNLFEPCSCAWVLISRQFS